MLSKNYLAQSPFTAIIALTAAAIHISLEIRLAIEADSTLLALNTQNHLERLFGPCKELSQYWPNAEGVLELFQSLLEKFKSKVVSILRNSGPRDTSTDGAEFREQTFQTARYENRADPGTHQGGVGEVDTGLNFDSGPRNAANANPMMDALDWQDILFHHVTQ